ncbi:hypothetical protein D1007_46768 [Hordeum vulgare]|nr:hypothetical protein D1007_46768 [Hordeum vulgare]
MLHCSMVTHQEPLLLFLLLLQIHLVVVCSLVSPTTNHTAVPAILPCLPDQASALIRLKWSFSNTQESITAFRSWRPETDCCRWEGIRCDDANGHVTSLDLAERGLQSGRLNHALFDLTSLAYLNLAYNDFNGSQLPSIGFERLVKLTHLNLSSSSFDGQIPRGVRRLTNLVILDFSTRFDIIESLDDGYYSSILADSPNARLLELNLQALVENLSHLRELHLGRVDLSNNGAHWCNALAKSSPELFVLSLPFCGLSGSICDALSSLHSLSVIDLELNYLSGPFPNFLFNFSNLSVVQLRHNDLEGWVSPAIFGHPNLVTINLHNVHVLDISNNMFAGPIPIPPGSAIFLNYSYNMFSSIPYNFGSHLSDVYLLDASYNNFSGQIPSSICGATNIQLLDLSYNNFNGSIPSCLMEKANGMQSLYLKENKLHGELPDNMNEGCSLEALDFHGNWIEGKLPRSLVACKGLEVLDVGNNQISDSFPCWMSTLHRLEVLVLKSNKFFGHVGQTLVEGESNCAFPSARIFDLSSNNFSGELPLDKWFLGLESMIYNDSDLSLVMGHGLPLSRLTYKYTTAVTYKGHDTTFAKILRTLLFIDMSNNSFRGSIPETLGELSLIRGLNMSQNFLTGKIPSQFGYLRQLEALDLSSNELSGVIPRELTSLDFLTTLNLSYNKLEGLIPESAHFLTFSNSSFMGNTGLCGPPLTKDCNNTSMPNLAPHPSERGSLDIMLFLFVGMGFGVGFAITIVMTRGLHIWNRS